MSENEVDIAGSLFANEPEEYDDVRANKRPADFDLNAILYTGGDGDSDEADGDEAFIAMQQRRSNRKTGNLQGKSAKKSGGFQAMGKGASFVVLAET